MTFPALHILARELRVRARKPWTAWLRVVVGLIAVLTTLSTLAWAQSTSWAASLPGKAAFSTLSVMLMVFCLIEGVRQTADCLSSERREGTLGLLFLTPLTGMDVLLGKLAATSLNSFYGFIAVFPVMAVTLAAGGLTGGEFWRSVLVLLNALFFALACGMWTSARQREESRSMVRGLALAFGVTFLAWIPEGGLRLVDLPNVSMSVALHLADDANYRTQSGRFWTTLLAGHVIAWLLLASAGRKLKSVWREGGQSDAATNSVTVSEVRPRDWPPWHRPADPGEAAFWLARRTWPQSRMVLIMLGLLAISSFGFPFYRFLGPGMTLAAGIDYSLRLLPIMVILFIASRPFGEARRSGAMELLMSTPLTPENIVGGYRQALWHGSSGCIATVLSLSVLLWTISMMMAGVYLVPYIVVNCVRMIVTGLAACSLGLYLGLRYESAVKATGYGMLWVLAIPWLCSVVFWTSVRPFLSFTGGAPWGYWLVQLIPALLGTLFHLGIIRWSRRQLHTRFRELASGGRT